MGAALACVTQAALDAYNAPAGNFGFGVGLVSLLSCLSSPVAVVPVQEFPDTKINAISTVGDRLRGSTFVAEYKENVTVNGVKYIYRRGVSSTEWSWYAHPAGNCWVGYRNKSASGGNHRVDFPPEDTWADTKLLLMVYKCECARVEYFRVLIWDYQLSLINGNVFSRRSRFARVSTSALYPLTDTVWENRTDPIRESSLPGLVWSNTLPPFCEVGRQCDDVKVDTPPIQYYCDDPYVTIAGQVFYLSDTDSDSREVALQLLSRLPVSRDRYEINDGSDVDYGSERYKLFGCKPSPLWYRSQP